MSYSTKGTRRRNRGKPCPYCNQPMRDGRSHPSPDHIWPHSKGGTLGENVVFVCYQCNQDKRATPLRVWHARLVAKGDKRARFVGAFIERFRSTVPAHWIDK